MSADISMIDDDRKYEIALEYKTMLEDGHSSDGAAMIIQERYGLLPDQLEAIIEEVDENGGGE